MEGTMAVVTQWAADFAPRNWAYCNGQLIAISVNTALFSLLGTTYGGDGRTTFGLPDMRSRTAVGAGQGLSYYSLGERGGTPTVSLHANNIPPHDHNGQISFSLQGNSISGTAGEPADNFPGVLTNGYSTAVDTAMQSPQYQGTVGVAGSGMPYSTEAPYLVVNYVICMYGIYPSRN